jgi:hypothetical protein
MNVRSVVGLEKEAAIKLLQDNGFKTRITREDDTSYFVTCDLRMDRVNLQIEKGKVTKVDMG